MNLVSKLYNEKKVLITLEKYDLSDLSTPHTIRQIIDNFDVIKDYYETVHIENINNLDNYIDFMLLEFITLFNEDSDYLLDPYKEELKEVIEYSTGKLNQIVIPSLIKYIKVCYKDIFEYNQKYFQGGVRRITLNLIIKYYNGVKSEGLFEYMVRKMPVFTYDNFAVLSKILKRDNGKLIKELLLDVNNFNELCTYRFDNICETAERLYSDAYKDIAVELGDMIYDYIQQQLMTGEQHIYYLQNIFNRANKTLYLLRSPHSKKVDSDLREIEKSVDEYLLENGREFHYEVTTEAYDKLMDQLDEQGLDYFTKYMTITHWLETNNLWYSRLEKGAKSYKPSLMDFVGTSINTNEYFTYGKLNSIDILITFNSMSLFYWFKNENRVNEFRNSLKLVINWIFESLDYDTKFDGLENDIDALIEILYSASLGVKDVLYHIKSMFVVSFLEKVLRLVYLCIEKEAFFDKSKITLGTTLGTSENNAGLLDDIIGEHHHRWTRYYFLNEDKVVGLNYRNRLAHLVDISVGEITLPVFMKIVWVTISTINSILVNLINNNEGDQI